MSHPDEQEPQAEGFPYGREFAYGQALASAKIEGFEADEEFTADYAELTAGRMTGEEFRARLTARCLKLDAEAQARKPMVKPK